jgi:hypothetical protein
VEYCLWHIDRSPSKKHKQSKCSKVRGSEAWQRAAKCSKSNKAKHGRMQQSRTQESKATQASEQASKRANKHSKNTVGSQGIKQYVIQIWLMLRI